MSVVRHRGVQQQDSSSSNHSGNDIDDRMTSVRSPVKTPEKDIELKE